MATLKEIIYNVKNLKQAGRQSQDALLSDAQYVFIIDYYRSVLISRDYMKKNYLAPQLEQTIKAKFKRAKDVEDEYGDMEAYKIELPSVVQTPKRPLYEGVRTSMLRPSIARSTPKRIRQDLRSVLTGRAMRYLPMGDALYVITPEPLQELYVSAIFDSPLAVREYEGKVDPFDPYNFEYQISPNMLDTIYKMIVDGEIRWSSAMQNDTTTDGNEEGALRQPRQTVRKEDEE